MNMFTIQIKESNYKVIDMMDIKTAIWHQFKI